MRRNRFVPAALAVGLVAGLAAPVGVEAAQAAPAAQAASARPAAAPAATLPAVYPTPQSMHAMGSAIPLGSRAGVVSGTDSDPAAVAAVRTVLTTDGVRTIDDVTDPAALPAGELAVVVGGSAARSAVGALGVTDASGLPAEGYVLADGQVGQRPTIALDGHDGTGTFYAAQTLRQLITPAGEHHAIAGVAVRDWPALPVRGVIEGFYGTPWSHENRLAQLDFYGAHKMNTYVYSPKDDAYLRAQWRDPYPPAQLAQIKQLVDRAIANHVEFTYALSPGLSICYSSADDEQALVAKFQSLWDIGVRTFSIPLDDISYTKWNCQADQDKWGTGGGAAGAAQSYLLDAVQRDFIATHPGASRLEMVPTEYSDTAASPYKNAIKADLDPAVVVGWTGVGVIAKTITAAQAAAAKSVFGHDILLWDNYPVNDYVTDRLLLGPYVGRQPGLPLYGITANPMIQPEASKIALFNVADYTWNDTAYDPQASWQAGLRELAGPDPQARTALAAFADLEHYSQLDPVQAPVLAARFAAFWPAWERGDRGAASALDTYLRVIAGLPDTLAARMPDPEFVIEAQPWLASAGTWGEAARAALQMLVDQRNGDAVAALDDRRTAEDLEAHARTYTYAGLNGSVHVTVGDGVLDTFLAAALAENDRWLGLTGRHVTATTSLPTYQTNVPAHMIDGDDSTFFWSSRPPSPGDYVGVDLGAVEPVTSVSIHMSKSTSPNDYIHGGVLEYSADGTHWAGAGTYVDTPDIEATLPAGAQARYVRLRDTGNQDYWVVVREFTVSGPPNDAPTVDGAPAGSTAHPLAAAADGDVDTSYVATSAPQAGDALTVTLPKARPLDRVGIVGTGRADVQIRTGGQWRSIGPLGTAGYVELAAQSVTADAIRLAWVAGSVAPHIDEIVPWYADAPTAGLAATPSAAETSVGATTAVTVGLSATQPRDVSGTLRIAAPDGVTAAPSRVAVQLDRGTQRSVAVTLTGNRVGSYQVPVTFTPDHGAAVTAQIDLVVHPAVSDTNVALASAGAVATASSTEQGLPQFTPDHAIDGDLSTRWSSDHADDEWLQVQLAAPQHLGKLVLHWESAHATEYRIETSSDGNTWTTAADVTDSLGGTEAVWIDQPDVTYVRMHGVHRATTFGYSIYELAAYPITG
jgi:hyaluronoglucosaminidase